MEQSGEPITFPAVARRAGVSVSLLYADAELASRIADRSGSPAPGRRQPCLAPADPLARHRTEPASRARQREGACPSSR